MSRKIAWAPVLLGLALLIASPLLAGSATTTILTVTDNGNETYTVSLSSVVGITTSDHMGARITNSSGPGGVWTVTEVRPALHASANTLLLTDNLYEERGAGTPFGVPIAGSAWYGTPTTAEALSRVPHTAVAWDGALRRNVFQSAAAINSRIKADGTTPLTANWDAGGYEIRSLTFESDATTGTAPFTVASTTVVTNLNADTVDGISPGTIATQAANNVSITGGSITGITDLAVADGGTGSSTAANARTALGVAIGSDVQAYDALLAAIAAVDTAGTGNLLVTLGAGTEVLNLVPGTTDYPLVSNGTGNVPAYEVLAVAGGGTGSTSAANARTALGLAIGTDVQAYDALLAAIAAVDTAGTGNLLVTLGAGTEALNVVPGTVDLPLVSNGAGAVPAYEVLAVAGGGTGSTTAAAARTALGLAIGTDVQGYGSAISALSFAQVRPIGRLTGTVGGTLAKEGLFSGDTITEARTSAIFNTNNATGTGWSVRYSQTSGAAQYGAYSTAVWRPELTLGILYICGNANEDAEGFAGFSSTPLSSLQYGSILGGRPVLHELGMAYEQAASDNNLYVVHNDGSGAGTATLLQAGVAKPGWYELLIEFNSATDVDVTFSTTRFGGAYSTSVNLTTNLPAAAVSVCAGANYVAGTEVYDIQVISLTQAR